MKAIVRPLAQSSQSMTVSIISSKATEPIVTKFYVEPPEAEGTKICLNRPGHMTSMVTTPIYGKNL